MRKYKFKALTLNTGQEVIGDLVYAQTVNERVKVKPMIIEVRSHGGIVWIASRCVVDEYTIEPVLVEE